MIKTSHHWFLYPFFERYGWFQMNRYFKRIHMTGDKVEKELPILILANHFSWWDGFFISSLNRKIFKKKFHVMMLEDQLRKNWFFHYTGAFSVRKNTKDIIESLQYCIELLQNPDNLLAFFPQGKFESVCQHPLHFEKGLEWVLKNLRNEVQMIFSANQVDYFDSAKPHLFLHFKTYDYQGKKICDIEKDYNDYFRTCSTKNLLLMENTC